MQKKNQSLPATIIASLRQRKNRPGAGSNIATEAAARSPADGHTMLLATLGALVVSPMVMRLAFDPQRDLAPVSIAVDLFNILVVPADRPWRSTAERSATVTGLSSSLVVISSRVRNSGTVFCRAASAMAWARLTRTPASGCVV